GRRRTAKTRGTMLPSFSRRGGFAATRRQAGLLAPGCAASLLAARRPAFPDPSWVEWLTWDWLPGYSGGTAPAFDRLPSQALSGAPAAGISVPASIASRSCASRRCRSQGGVPLHGQVRPQLAHDALHTLHAGELLQAGERTLRAAR